MPGGFLDRFRRNAYSNMRAEMEVNIFHFVGAGAPTSGTSGTAVNIGGYGSTYYDTTNKVLYMNTNTLASPTWTVQNIDKVTGDVTFVAGVSVIGANKVLTGMLGVNVIQIASGQITKANIIGTGAGQLGHANGVVLVAACAAGSVNQFIGGIVALDFATAAYTAGGNVTINISGGGAALTGLVSNVNFIQSAADKIIEFVPLAATFNNYGSGANGIALVSSAAPTDPGTAAGVINWQIAYRTIPGLIT